MRRGCGRGVALLLATGAAAVTLALVPAEPAAAQQRPPVQQRPPARPQATPEEEADSARAQILRQLELLGRPLGYDTVLFRQDSIAQAALQPGRPGAVSRGGPDSTMAQLQAMPGYAITEYTGARATFQAGERQLLLQAAEGDRATVVREGYEVQADSTIVYDDASGRLRTSGLSTFTPTTGDPVESARLVYDVSQQRGSAFGADTEYTQAGARWLVHGDMPFAAPDSSYMSHARFTSCDLEEPHYHFETDQIKIVAGKVLVARPVRMYFADVPVAWLPFVAQSLSSGRASGLLTPRFSMNDIVRTSTGYNRRVSNIGFYWAMSQYSDALFAFDWFSENFVSLSSQLQYRWNRQFLNGGLSFRRYWNADGSGQYAFDTQHAWEYDERTQMSLTARYTSDTDFVRQYSLNPREVTQEISSQGGVNRRFDWGSVNVSADRQQYLSDDRVVMTLPSANISLSTVTLFRAPSSRARFWNNMTWGGGTTFRRNTVDRIQPDTFSYALTDTEDRTVTGRSTLSLGALSFSQNVQVQDAITVGVPDALLTLGDTAPADLLLRGAPASNIARTTLSWTASMGYQQRLIGSTTLTPSVSVNGQMLKSDTLAVAQEFVSAPTRVALNADLKSDVYGFFPGFGPFEAIRHKVSPSVGYSWSPSTSPTQLQRDVFRSGVLQPRSVLDLSINQTWEAKRRQDEEPRPTRTAARGDTLALLGDSAALADSTALADSLAAEGGPRRLQQGQTVTLLGLTTSAVTYDFVEADSTGLVLGGFQTTQLSNNISSDYLRGLSINFTHDVFADSIDTDRRLVSRRFDPHLSQLNLSFSIGSSSGFVRWLSRLTGGEAVAEEDAPEEPELVDPSEEAGATDEASVIPGVGLPAPRDPTERSRGTPGGWNASLSYALQRPRSELADVNQMIQGTLTLKPTANWNLSWRTSYDVERGHFNDHMLRLTRDLHRWQANFDFRQTATGNWSFQFEVSLIDNRDLKFDYNQRNIDVGSPVTRRR